MKIEEIRKQKKMYSLRYYGIRSLRTLLMLTALAFMVSFITLLMMIKLIESAIPLYCTSLISVGSCILGLYMEHSFELPCVNYFTYWRKLEILYSYLNGEPYPDKDSTVASFCTNMYSNCLSTRNLDIHYDTKIPVPDMKRKKRILNALINNKEIFLLEPYRLRVTISLDGCQDEFKFEVVVDPEALTYQLAKDLLTAKQLKALDLTEKEGNIFSVS